MAHLILPSRFNRQPQHPADVAIDNPLTDGLTFLWTPSSGYGIDAVNKILGSDAGGGALSATPEGIAYTAVAGTSNGLHFGSSLLKKVITGNAYTVMVLAKPTASATRSSAFTNGYDGASPWAQQAFMFNAGSGTSISGSIEINEYDGGVKIIGYSSSTSVVDGDWHIFTGARNGSNVLLYRDGVSLAVSYSGADTGTANVLAGKTTVGGADGSSRAAPYPIAFVAVWNRALSPSEVAQISL